MFTYPPISTGFKDKEHYYFAEGKLELLDAENEWFFDTVTKELYAWVPGGGSPDPVAHTARLASRAQPSPGLATLTAEDAECVEYGAGPYGSGRYG